MTGPGSPDQGTARGPISHRISRPWRLCARPRPRVPAPGRVARGLHLQWLASSLPPDPTPRSISGSASSVLAGAASDAPMASDGASGPACRASPVSCASARVRCSSAGPASPAICDRMPGRCQPTTGRSRVPRRRFRKPVVGLVTLTLEGPAQAARPARQRPPRRVRRPSISTARRAFFSWAPTSPQGRQAAEHGQACLSGAEAVVQRSRAQVAQPFDRCDGSCRLLLSRGQ